MAAPRNERWWREKGAIEDMGETTVITTKGSIYAYDLQFVAERTHFYTCPQERTSKGACDQLRTMVGVHFRGGDDHMSLCVQVRSRQAVCAAEEILAMSSDHADGRWKSLAEGMDHQQWAVAPDIATVLGS